MICLVAWLPLDLQLVPRSDSVLAVLEMVSDTVHSDVKLVMPPRRLSVDKSDFAARQQ
jgi:hypothetical protein